MSLDDLLGRIDELLAEPAPVDTRWHPDRCTCHACRGKTSRDAFRPAGVAPPFAWAGRTFQVSDEVISDYSWTPGRGGAA